MKRTITTFCLALFASFTAFAEYSVATVDLYDSPSYEPQGFCDVGTHLVLDEAKVMGKVAFLSEFVAGICEIFVIPNERMYTLTGGAEDHCGAVVYRGEKHTEKGVAKLTITDNRNNQCSSVSNFVVKEELPGDSSERVLYSFDLEEDMVAF